MNRVMDGLDNECILAEKPTASSLISLEEARNYITNHDHACDMVNNMLAYAEPAQRGLAHGVITSSFVQSAYDSLAPDKRDLSGLQMAEDLRHTFKRLMHHLKNYVDNADNADPKRAPIPVDRTRAKVVFQQLYNVLDADPNNLESVKHRHSLQEGAHALGLGQLDVEIGKGGHSGAVTSRRSKAVNSIGSPA